MENPRVEANDIVAALDDAVEAILHWCRDWHIDFVVADDDIHSSDAIAQQRKSLKHFDAFDAWFAAHQGVGIVDQPSMIRLHALSVSIRRRVEKHCASGTSVSSDDYKELMAEFSSFVMQARRLERAFATASSDLDTLTGIQNRHAMHRALSAEHERVVRNNRPSILALVDLDHFKSVNDTHGHAAGDRVLRIAAGIFAQNVRANDQVFRFGGEEFLILLTDTDPETAAAVLGRLRSTMETRRIALDDKTISITASFGVALMTPNDTPERTIELADGALYRAKEMGRNRVVFDG